MPPFPSVDPIPLPAPIWLFKILEMVTLTLHFLAVQALLGGLLVCSLWAILGRMNRQSVLVDGSGLVASRLPVLMTYVINLGVPPLLFAQVLYGRALYTSSVLIGAFWISIIFLLMIAYTLLYILSQRAESGKPWGWVGLMAFVVCIGIAYIYSSNMTLMNRPDVWRDMYRNDPVGLHLNTGDPTVLPRWLFMILGGGCAGGTVLLLLSKKKFIAASTSSLLAQWAPPLIVIGAVGQILAAFWVFSSQPEEVRKGLMNHAVFGLSVWLWLILAVGVLGSGLWAWKSKSGSVLSLVAVGLALFLEVFMSVLARSGIRDVTLLLNGFDVWDLQVASNWIVVGAFLLLFVLGIGVLVWLASVVARAKGVEERYV